MIGDIDGKVVPVGGRWAALRPIGRRTIAVAVLLLALVACGDGDDESEDGVSTEENGSAAALTIVDFAYDPDPLEVAVGTTVEVVNEDAATHTVTADDGSFDVRLDGGATDSFTVNTPGGFPFACTVHPSMTGTLVVD